MKDIDLTPATFRRLAAARRLLRTVLLLAALVLVAGATGAAWASWQLKQAKERLPLQQRDRQEIAALRERMLMLREQHDRQVRTESALQAVRGAGGAAAFARALDAALNDGVWLLSLQLQRQHQRLDAATDSQQRASTQQDLTQQRVELDGRLWQFATRLEMRGRADNHTALARFINKLANQPRVADVRFLSSQVHREEDAVSVEFVLHAFVVPELAL